MQQLLTEDENIQGFLNVRKILKKLSGIYSLGSQQLG
jgi:hypothetical protein